MLRETGMASWVVFEDRCCDPQLQTPGADNCVGEFIQFGPKLGPGAGEYGGHGDESARIHKRPVYYRYNDNVGLRCMLLASRVKGKEENRTGRRGPELIL